MTTIAWNTLMFGGIVPILQTVAELVKRIGLNDRYLLVTLAIIALGVGAVAGWKTGDGWAAGLVSGLLQLLMATGLYKATKSSVLKGEG